MVPRGAAGGTFTMPKPYRREFREDVIWVARKPRATAPFETSLQVRKDSTATPATVSVTPRPVTRSMRSRRKIAERTTTTTT